MGVVDGWNALQMQKVGKREISRACFKGERRFIFFVARSSDIPALLCLAHVAFEFYYTVGRRLVNT